MTLTKDDLPISFFDEIQYYHVLGKFDGITQAEQVRDQILKNQEDAEKWDRLENAKTHEALVEYASNAEIVERLKKHLALLELRFPKERDGVERYDFSEEILLKKILGEKNDTN